MELAALHQYPDGSHALRSEDISLDVVSDHDHIGGFSSQFVECSLKEGWRRLSDDGYFDPCRCLQSDYECPHVEREAVSGSVAEVAVQGDHWECPGAPT